eukprot:38574_1
MSDTEFISVDNNETPLCTTITFYNIISFICRLEFLRFTVSQVALDLEDYYHAHIDKTCCSKCVILIYLFTILLLLPIYIIILLNDLLVALYYKLLRFCRQTQKQYFISSNSNQTIRLMSYNIHSGYGMDNKLDINRIAKCINSQNVDILCLQEAEWESTRYKSDQTKDIANMCGLKYYHIEAAHDQHFNGYFGNSICSKYIILDTKILKYPKFCSCNRSKRNAIAVKLDIGNNNYIWCINTHFQNDIVYYETQYQSYHLVHFVNNIVENEMKNDSSNEFIGVIIAGDFNLPVVSSPIQYLKNKFVSCDMIGSTFPASNPISKLDHIWLHNNEANKLMVDRNSCYVVNDSISSDHRPVFVQFCI